MELIDNDFQKIINRLENKGNDEEMPIMKLNFARKLRKQTGQRMGQYLDMYEGHVYDSSHIIGARIIKHFLRKKQKSRA